MKALKLAVMVLVTGASLSAFAGGHSSGKKNPNLGGSVIRLQNGVVSIVNPTMIVDGEKMRFASVSDEAVLCSLYGFPVENSEDAFASIRMKNLVSSGYPEEHAPLVVLTETALDLVYEPVDYVVMSLSCKTRK